MVKINLKKTDIDRILRALGFFEMHEKIDRENYKRLFKKLFRSLK